MTDFDTLITGGQLVDGTGAPAATDDVGIKDGRIAALGNLSASAAVERIDARGLVVRPGFIGRVG